MKCLIILMIFMLQSIKVWSNEHQPFEGIEASSIVNYSFIHEVTYNEQNIQAFNDIVLAFHQVDFEAIQALQEQYKSLENYLKFAANLLETRANWLKEGTGALLLVKRNGEFVGGTYYRLLDDESVLYVSCAGYKNTLPFSEVFMMKKMVVDILSSSNNFPNTKKMVVLLRHGSDYISELTLLGFVDSDYMLQEHFDLRKYRFFEKPMA